MTKFLFELLQLLGATPVLAILFQGSIDTFTPMPSAFQQIDGGNLTFQAFWTAIQPSVVAVCGS